MLVGSPDNCSMKGKPSVEEKFGNKFQKIVILTDEYITNFVKLNKY